MNAAALLIDLVQYYSIGGALVAILFITIGIDRIDEDARGAYAFRPLLIPAVLLIWPIVLWRWVREETGRATWRGRYSPPLRAQGVVAALMGLSILLTLCAGQLIRQTWPADIAPVQLEAPE